MFHRIRCFLLILLPLAHGTASGASLVWNAAVNTDWNNTTANWSGAVWNSSTPDRAVFGVTGAGTVNLTTAISANQLTFTSAGYYIAGNTLTLGGITPTITTDANASISSILAGTAGLIKAGSGTLVLTGANTYGGGTMVNAGTLQIGSGAANGTIGSGTYAIANGASLFLNYATAAAPTWSKVTGAGTLELNSTQAVNGSANWGAVALQSGFAGTLRLDKGRVHGVPNGLGAAGAMVIGNGAQYLAYDGTTGGTAYTYTQDFSINGMGWGESGHNLGALRVSGLKATITGNVALTGNAGLYTQSGAANSSLDIAGIITDGGGGYGLTINAGSNPITLSGNNTYGGSTVVSIGTLQLGAAGVIPDGSGKGNVSVTSVFDLNTFSETINGLSGTGTVDTVAGGTPTLTVGNNNQTSTFSGTLKNTTGTLSLVKTGGGTLTFSGTSTFSGPTTVSGGTLAGTGTLSSPTTIQSGATLAPGSASIGALTISKALTYMPGSNHVARINKSGTTLSADLVRGMTSVVYGGNLSVMMSGDALGAGDSFTLFQAGAYSGAFAGVNLPVLPAGLTWDASGLAFNGMLVVADSTPPTNEGAKLVGKHSIVLTSPVGGPTQFMPTGPLIGNGDIGVMQSGPAEQLAFYIGKNDFWGIATQSPMAVGQLRILTPDLQGAGFKTTEDMQLAEIRGEYTKGDASLASRAWVDANRNLFCVELSNKGAAALPVKLQTIKGTASLPPSSVQDNTTQAKIGCEQHGGGRWFFNGQMADVAVLDRALTPAEITGLAQGGRNQVTAFDGATSYPFATSAISSALTISGWINVTGPVSTEANYIVSKGDWNQAYSLGLSAGHLRFAIGNTYLQCDDLVPLNQWVHVAGVFDSSHMELRVDGVVKKEIGSNSDAGAAFFYDPDAPDVAGRKLALATRVVGGMDAREFSLDPGATVVVASGILTDLDAGGADPRPGAQALVDGLTTGSLNTNTTAHRQWWTDYWNRSLIEIPDKMIEQCWYSAWYIMGSCSRAGKVAPGLWGNWITVNNPAWHGDFHLNYNFQAPYYGLYSANHTETTQPFYDAMNQSIPRGQSIAAARGWTGIHLPVSIGPWGMCPEGNNADWGQRSNAAFCALPYIWHWQYSHDQAWLNTIGYAYLKETATFWENYLKLEDGRYVIYNDSIHEGSGPDMNPLLSLGLVRTLFKNIVPMSEALGVDADKRDKWRDISEKISAFPTQVRNGKTVFRYSEVGTAWWPDNTLGIQHIYPAGAIGLDSDPSLLSISRDMIDEMSRWQDYNGSSSWYTACSRVGYNPVRILDELHAMYAVHTLPNKLLNFGGGGIENVSPALAITEMLLQSHEGVIRLFPNWTGACGNARFRTLRAVGAFLVSGNLKNGTVSGVEIVSEKGLDCTIQNPWPASKVQVTRNGNRGEVVEGARFSLNTSVGDTLTLAPAGPYDLWAQEIPAAVLRDPMADADHDGECNLLEFAFGGDPVDGSKRGFSIGSLATFNNLQSFAFTIASRAGSSFAADSSGKMTLTVDGITCQIEASSDLENWTEAVLEVTPALTADLPSASAGYVYHTFRLASGVAERQHAFLRLKAMQP